MMACFLGTVVFCLGLTAVYSGTVAKTVATRVNVDLYMEALCPDCIAYTHDVLQPMMRDGYSTIMNLTVIPYGNAKRDPTTGQLRCQHGTLECRFNELLNCALYQKRSQDEFFRFLSCIEGGCSGWTVDVLKLGSQCVEGSGLEWPSLQECLEGGLGEALHEEAGKATDALKPPHQYVPWVVVNGVPLGSNTYIVPKVVCAAYTGDDRPEACYLVTDKEDMRAGRGPFALTTLQGVLKALVATRF